MKKNIFKSDIFKCIAVLLTIMVIAGGLLAILNDVLFVSDSERLNRAVKKVYGKEVTAAEETVDFEVENKGKIENVYAFTDEGKDYKLFKSTGYEGYKGGTITLWILVPYAEGQPEKIQKVVLGDSDKQTLMSKLTGKFYGAYAELNIDEIKDGKLVSVKDGTDFKNVVSGATKSSNAANNAVNAVLLYLWGENV